MIVSPYHRLLGLVQAIAYFYRYQPEALLLKDFSLILGNIGRKGLAGIIEFESTFAAPDDPFKTALLLSSLILFFHEDPNYLQSRLARFNLPVKQRSVVEDLSRIIGACFREALTPNNFSAGILTQSAYGSVLADCFASVRSWDAFLQQLRRSDIGTELRQLLAVYGAIALGRADWSVSLRLVGDSSEMVQLWVALLIGLMRGDRHCPIMPELGNAKIVLKSLVLDFWSRWSGIPLENQLQLNTYPLIASVSVIQPRPQLPLISEYPLS